MPCVTLGTDFPLSKASLIGAWHLLPSCEAGSSLLSKGRWHIECSAPPVSCAACHQHLQQAQRGINAFSLRWLQKHGLHQVLPTTAGVQGVEEACTCGRQAGQGCDGLQAVTAA